MSEVEDPVAYFLEDMTYHGKSERTVESYRRVLRRFETHLGERGVEPATASQRDCLSWVHSLRAASAPSTVATYASYLHRFYAYMTQAGVLDANPMALVMEELDESVDKNPTRRDISVAEMGEFIAGIGHPLDRAVLLTLLKTGLRVGELTNLDRRDLNLSGLDWPVRAQIDGRPNTLYVDSEVGRGAVVNGERRTAANKRKRDTLVPIDGELRGVLARWLAIRPDTASSAEPLFASTRSEWGQRLTPAMARDVVGRHAREMGWYRRGGDAGENVTPHYFRHFFTTHLRDRTGDRGVVKYLRGDVADDVIDTYTHNWGDRVRDVYEANIYSLL
jgi:site-specific recombinase XerD